MRRSLAAPSPAAGWRHPGSWARRRPARRRGAPRRGKGTAPSCDELQMSRRLATPSPIPGSAGGPAAAGLLPGPPSGVAIDADSSRRCPSPW
eukprot:5374825-Alexandrium_andersonii.AAC.1